MRRWCWKYPNVLLAALAAPGFDLDLLETIYQYERAFVQALEPGRQLLLRVVELVVACFLIEVAMELRCSQQESMGSLLGFIYDIKGKTRNVPAHKEKENLLTPNTNNMKEKPMLISIGESNEPHHVR